MPLSINELSTLYHRCVQMWSLKLSILPLVVSEDASLGGSYDGVEPMGLLWSMKPIPGSKSGLRLAVGFSSISFTILLQITSCLFEFFMCSFWKISEEGCLHTYWRLHICVWRPLNRGLQGETSSSHCCGAALVHCSRSAEGGGPGKQLKGDTFHTPRYQWWVTGYSNVQ